MPDTRAGVINPQMVSATAMDTMADYWINVPAERPSKVYEAEFVKLPEDTLRYLDKPQRQLTLQLPHHPAHVGLTVHAEVKDTNRLM